MAVSPRVTSKPETDGMPDFHRCGQGSGTDTWTKGFAPGSARILLLLAWFLGNSAVASNWYVDNALVGSANNGTAWTSAWTNFSSVVWGNNGVKAGDTLFISGGSTSQVYTNMWSVGASGVAGSPIRIAIDASNSNHWGQVIFDYNYAGDQASFTGISCPQNYVTFDGNVGGACHFVVNNLRNYMVRTTAIGIDASSSTGTIIDHIASTNCNNPIRVNGSTGFRVSNCQLRQVRGDAAIAAAGCSGSWDANIVCSNMIEILFNSTPPPGATAVYVGPDGVQCTSGITIYGNTTVEHFTTVYTSSQHPDMVQATGDYIKVYGNEFINVGDSVFDYDCYANSTPHDVWIYNNVYRITNSMDPYPEYFRLYASANSVSSIVNFKIFNNTFIDNNFQYRVIRFDTFNGNPTASGNEIKNNIFYNCGGGNTASPVIWIDNSSGFATNSFTFDANVYYQPGTTIYIMYSGTAYTAPNWISAFEPKGKTGAPQFVSYAAFAPGNNVHLQGSDTVAKDAGLSLSNYFTTDKDGVSRPQGAGWDIGAYEYASGVASTNPVIAVTPASLDFGSIPAGTTADQTFTVQNTGGGMLSGTASVSGPFSIVSGGSYNLGSNQTQVVTVQYSPLAAGTTSQNVTFTGGAGATAIVTGSATAVLSGLVFEADSGDITAPFIITNGYIYQAIQTGVTNGGRASYSFTISNSGEYVVQGVVNAPSDAENSLYVNIDAEPQDPAMVWQIPITTGFESLLVNWQGNGTSDNPQFVPKVFTLAPGIHQLIIRGREPNTQLETLAILSVPQPPQNLHIVPNP
jgi:hypothetical protein